MMVTPIGSTGLRPALDAPRTTGSPAATPAAAAPAAVQAEAAPSPVKALVAEGPPVDTDRVAEIRAAIATGSYRIEIQAIAARMIAADLPFGQ